MPILTVKQLDTSVDVLILIEIYSFKLNYEI